MVDRFLINRIYDASFPLAVQEQRSDRLLQVSRKTRIRRSFNVDSFQIFLLFKDTLSSEMVIEHPFLLAWQ